MRTYLIALAASSLAGCATHATPSPGTKDPVAALPLPAPSAPLPAVTGAYLGRYLVPAPDNLTDAASFPLDSVEWVVTAGVATLHYNLPRGLVGGIVQIDLSGTLPTTITELDLTGAKGEGRCVATGTKITCREVFGDLGALPISMPVVEQVAAQQFPGPVASRVAVANLFGIDPIGIVEFDLSQPTVPDTGGGGGGGSDDGGGGGSGHP